jgi:two-component system, cell cycle sensor histidine kinase and response regulator CckA
MDFPGSTESIQILLVEDAAALRRFVRLILEESGYEVLEAENGLEALRVVRQTQREVQLLLTDVIMPQMGGRELAEHLRLEYPDLKVIFVSGYDFGHIGALRPGMHFLQKPFTPSILLAKIEQVLAESEDASAGGQSH